MMILLTFPDPPLLYNDDMVEIRAIQESDIPLLEQRMDYGGRAKHRKRFARQIAGEVVYLIAWLDGAPVGHALLKWGGTADEPMASALHDCPDIEDLRVHPDYQSRGIGSLLLDAAEEVARERGFARVGLGVSLENGRARALYERRGYCDAGFGVYYEGGSFADAQGQVQWWQEACVYLVKDLSAGGMCFS